MTQAQIISAIKASSEDQVRIVQGEGSDRDYGFASLAPDGSVTVGWDSGVRTALYGDDAELA